MESIEQSIQNLKNSNKLSELLLDNTDEALFFYSMEGKLIYVNPAFENITGYTVKELHEKNFIPYVHPDDQEWTMKLYEGLYQGELFNDVHFRIIKKNGDVRWHSSSWKLVYDDNNRKIGIQGKQRDISDQKKLEHYMIEEKRSAELANKAKSIFLSNMSHEIRTPLTAIMGFAELLKVKPNIEASDRLMFTNTILESGKHLVSLINEILDLSKIEAGEVKLEKIKIETYELIKSVTDSLTLKAESSDIDLQIIYNHKIPDIIFSDPTRITQILYNLIGNSIKFSEKGKVCLTVKLRNNESILVFEVTDTGSGISLDKQSDVFKPFHQMDESISRKYGGTGLGLGLSKKLAKMLGGDLLLIKSEPNKGSTFEFYIPVSQLEEPSVVPIKKQNKKDSFKHFDELSGVLKGIKILIAEDGDENQKLFREILEFAAAKLYTVKDGEAAVKEALKNQYDVILMDLQLPVMNGYDAARTLRKNGYLAPIIAVSANALKEDKLRSIEAGCNDYQSKPVSAVALISIVKKWSQKSREI